MNENLNLVEILKDAPKGTKLWSPLFGEHKYHIEKVNDKLSKLVEDPNSTFDSKAYIKWHEDRQKKIDEGLKLFAEHFQDLWI